MQKESKFKKIARNAEMWKEYIDNLGTPKDDVQRTEFHLKCMYLCESTKQAVAWNILSAFILPLSILGTAIYSFFYLKRTERNRKDCIFFNGGSYYNITNLQSVIPDELIKEFPKWESVYQKRGRGLFFTGFLDKDVWKQWIYVYKRYPLFWGMNLSIFTHLTAINKIIKKYNPRAIITLAAENDFTSSCITSFCEKRNIEYISVMHGEYFLTPVHAFVRFSRFYVWDNYYIEQFVKTGSPKEFFFVYTPKRYLMSVPSQNIKKYYIGYYMQEQSENVMINIRNILKKFVDAGYQCKVRPHPHATDIKSFQKVFSDIPGITIENPSIAISESLGNCEFIVSVYSTVLSEAYFSNMRAVIDDISDLELYRELQNIMYINIKRIHLRLSGLLEGIGNK